MTSTAIAIQVAGVPNDGRRLVIQGEGIDWKMYILLPKKGGNKVLEASPETDAATHQYVYLGPHGFTNMLRQAFTEHLPVELNPRDVWVVILQSLGRYVECNADKCKTLLITGAASASSAASAACSDGSGSGSGAKEEIIEDIAIDTPIIEGLKGVARKTQARMKIKIDLEFSTSTETSQIVTGLSVMNVCKDYFTYVVRTRCGIPAVLIKGTCDDWLKICSALDQICVLSDPDVVHWIKRLQTTLGKITEAYGIAAAAGKQDNTFWRSIYKHESHSGSDIVDGWFLDFFLLDSENQLIHKKEYSSLLESRLCAQVTTVPFIRRIYEQDYPMEVVSGLVAVQQDPETRALRPVQAWAVVQ